MKIRMLLVLIAALSLSCEHQPPNDLFKTTDGEFASKMGKFVAAYPTKPFHTIARQKLDDSSDLYQEFHIIRSTFGDQKVFTVEYVDMKEDFVNTNTTEEILSMGLSLVKDYVQKLNFEKGQVEKIKLQTHEGYSFTYLPNSNFKKYSPSSRATGKVVVREDRLYFLIYLGKMDRQSNMFLKSFRFTK